MSHDTYQGHAGHMTHTKIHHSLEAMTSPNRNASGKSAQMIWTGRPLLGTTPGSLDPIGRGGGGESEGEGRMKGERREGGEGKRERGRGRDSDSTQYGR